MPEIVIPEKATVSSAVAAVERLMAEVKKDPELAEKLGAINLDSILALLNNLPAIITQVQAFVAMLKELFGK